MSEQLLITITFALYLAAVFVIGLIAYRRTHDATDYFLGGRKLSPAVAALSAGASDMSGWVLLGLPGAAYLSGLEAGWMGVGLCLGVAANWLLVARRLRVYSYALDDAVTLPVFFQRRFADTQPWLRSICALFILLFFLFYVSSGLMGGGKLFVAVFGLDYQWAVICGAAAVISYTLFGGFLAVSWTDVVQGLLMTLALVAVPIVISGSVGGTLAVVEGMNPELINPLTDVDGNPLGVIALISLLGWGLAYFGQPHILARFKAVRSEADIPTAATIGIGWSIIIYTASVAVGVSGIAALEQPLPDSEKVFMALVELAFHPLIAGVLLAAILAAVMSTVDSQLLVCSSALADDLVEAVTGKTLESTKAMKLGRIAVVLLAMLATWLALDPESTVLGVVAYAWGGLGAAFGPALLISLYWRRMNKYGALAGVIVGGATVIIWAQLQGGWFDLYELVPGFFFSGIAVVVVSLLTPEPEDSVVETFDRVLLNKK